MMRIKNLILFLFLLNSAFIKADDDADYLARRIMTLWQEGQEPYALLQAKEFIKEHPEHPLTETFCLFAGELFLKKRMFGKAIFYLDKIKSKEGKEKSYPFLFQSLYKVEQYDTLYEFTKLSLESSPTSLAKLYQAHAIVHSPQVHNQIGIQNALEEAYQLYQSLETSELKDEAYLGMAHILELKGQYSDAIEMLSQDPSNAKLLYQSAQIQLKHEPMGAINTLEQVIELRGSYGILASIQYANFLIKKDPALVLKKKVLLESTLKEKVPDKLYSILGIASFQVGSYKDALSYIDLIQDRNFKDSNLYVAALASSFKLDMLDSFNEYFTAFEKRFKELPSYKKSHLWRGLLLKERDPEEAWKSFSILAKTKRPEAITARIELGELGFKIGKAKEGHKILRSVYLENPSSKESAYAYQQLCLLTFKEIVKEDSSFSDREYFLSGMEKAMATQEEIKDELYLSMVLAYAQTLKSIGRDQSFKVMIKNLLKKSAQTPSVAFKVHTYLSDIAKQEGKEDAFVFHLERALSCASNPSNIVAIHTKLFNYYLNQKELNFEKAAMHLRAAYDTDPSSIKGKNLQWLGMHYYKKIEKFITDLDHPPIKASILSEDALVTQSIFNSLLPESDTPDLLTEKLAKLYLWIDEPEQAIDTLASYDFPEDQIDISLLYISAYQKMGSLKKAQEILERISHKANPKKLSYTLYDLAQDMLDDETSLALDWLKKVSLYKDPSSEPIHLNAAIEWAEREAHTPFYSHQKHLENLYAVKASFESKESIQDRDYHKLLDENPEKKKLYDSYQIYLKTVIAKIESLEAKKKGKLKEAYFKQELYEILHQTLHKQSVTTNSFLKKKISLLEAMGEV